MTHSRLLGIGGAHIDRRGRMTSPFVAGASIPGTMREDAGGGTFNALRTAVQRGARAALISLRGGDAAGEAVARAIAEAGIADLSAVFLDRSTPSYTALLDSGGDVVAALADMGLYEIAFPKQLRRAKMREEIAAADAVICDANIPATGLSRLASLSAGKLLFAIAISPAKAVRLAGVLGSLSAMFMNAREAAALAGGTEARPLRNIAALQAFGLKRGFITRGADAALAFDGDAVLELKPPAVDVIPDVTGAGDAFAAGAMMALLAGRPSGEALRQGVAAAALKLRDVSAAPSISRAALDKALRALTTPTKPQAESCE